MSKIIPHDKLAELIARRFLSEIEDHGGIEEFCEKLSAYPEQYLFKLGFSAVDCINKLTKPNRARYAHRGN